MFMSNCCNAGLFEESDICSECGEHCEKVKFDAQDYLDDAYDRMKDDGATK